MTKEESIISMLRCLELIIEYKSKNVAVECLWFVQSYVTIERTSNKSQWEAMISTYETFNKTLKSMEVKLADEWASPIDSPFGLKTTGRLCIALFYNKLSSCIRKGIHNKERMLETLEAHVEQYEEAIPELEWAISTYKSLATTVNTEELCQDQQS